MSACASVPALALTLRRGFKKRRPLRGSEKFALGLLLVSLLGALATRGAIGAEVLTAAIACGFFLLPLEYLAVTLVLGPLLPLVLGTLPAWYVTHGRWFLIFGGTAVVWFRSRPSRQAAHGASQSPFRALFVVYAAVAGMTILTSTSPSLSAAKWLLLIAGLTSFSVYSQWLVRAKGGQAAAVWVRAWVLVLAPILASNAVARLWGLEGSTAGFAFRGLAGNANSLGVILALTLPLLICQFLYRRRRASPLVQAYGILLAASLLMLYASWSRASMGAFVAGMAVLFWIHPINRLNRFAVLGVLLVVAVLVSGPKESLESFEEWLYKGRAEEGLLAARSEQWEVGYQSFRERPLLGGGFGVTGAREDDWELDNFRYLKVEQGSSLSALLGQVGLLGSLPIYLAIIWLLPRSVSYARRVRDPWLSGVVAAAFVGFVNSFFEGWLAAPGSGLYWFVVFQFFFLDAVMSHLKPPPLDFSRVPGSTAAAWERRVAPAHRSSVVEGRVGDR